MLEKLESCPVCNNAIFTDHLICTDHLLTGEKFHITKCNTCSFLLTNPRPQSKHLEKYYKSEAYISHSNKGNSLTNYLYKLVRYYTLAKKIKLINSLTNNKCILDFGCGTGNFLKACKKSGWRIHGLEPDKNARSIATKLTETSISSEINSIPKHLSFGLVTMWHVLEHVPELNKTLTQIIDKLDHDGKLLIAVPNHLSYDAMLYKKYWAAYDVPRHLYHFSRETMDLLLRKHGLNIYTVLPMKLDSFYVSLLSEKYKNKSTNYITSFINGYKSNVYAKNNNDNYSSLIYIAGK